MITYEEFEKEIKRIANAYNLNLEVLDDGEYIIVRLECLICVSIGKYEHYILDTLHSAFSSLKDSPKYELFVICSELAQTPIPKREQKKKFYIKHKFLYKNTDTGYINIDIHGYMILADKEEGLSMRTKFTQKEIDEIKEKYNTDLKDFEIIEVGK